MWVENLGTRVGGPNYIIKIYRKKLENILKLWESGV